MANVDRFSDIETGLATVGRQLEQQHLGIVVGFQRCGKSTFAETLSSRLRQNGYDVLLQSAESWIYGRRLSGNVNQDGQVDAEIDEALDWLKSKGVKSCWVLDDAEVMVAHASEAILSKLRHQLSTGHIRVVLIRNRFVLDDRGWFHNREGLLRTAHFRLEIQPLQIKNAASLACSLFDDSNRVLRGEWLANWSGGVPGLIYELRKFAPLQPQRNEYPEQLVEWIHARCARLELERPMRSQVIGALRNRVLPPKRLLSSEALLELGYLSVLGMVTPEYSQDESPFRGKAWSSLAEWVDSINAAVIPANVADFGLELEILVNEAGFLSALCEDIELPTADGTLAQALAQALYCSIHMPQLVTPISNFLAESLGRVGLRRLLAVSGQVSDSDSSGRALAEQLVEALQHEQR